MNPNPKDFWRNLEGKSVAIGAGAVLLGWALLDNAYRDGVQTGLKIAERGGDARMRDFDHGFPFGWLLILTIVGVVGWRKGWWGGQKPSGPTDHGRSLAPPPWTPRPPAAPAPPAWTPQAPPAAPTPPSQATAEVRVPVTAPAQAAAPGGEAGAPPTAPPTPAESSAPNPAEAATALPTATPEASAPEYRRTVGETGWA